VQERPSSPAAAGQLLPRLFLWTGLAGLAAINVALWKEQYSDLPRGLSVLVPYHFIASVVVFVLLAIPSPRTFRFLGQASFWFAAINAAAAIVLFLPVWLRSNPPTPETRHDAAVRVMTANLWTNYRAIPDFITLVETERPDFIFIQEGYEPWRSVLARELAGYTRVAGCDYRHTCNSVVFSRWSDHELIEGDGKGFAAAKVWRSEVGRLDSVTLVGVHISRSDPARARAELLDLGDTVPAGNSDLIIAGDFNMSPWDPRLGQLQETYDLHLFSGLGKTWPTHSRLDIQRKWIPIPGVSIDHVLAGQSFARIGAPRRIDFGSDHFAVIVDLAISSDRNGQPSLP